VFDASGSCWWPTTPAVAGHTYQAYITVASSTASYNLYFTDRAETSAPFPSTVGLHIVNLTTTVSGIGGFAIAQQEYFSAETVVSEFHVYDIT
jgi:hypothetical protein